MAEVPQKFTAALLSGEIAAIVAAGLFALSFLVGLARIKREPNLVFNNLRPGASPGLLALVLLSLLASLGVIFAVYA